MRIHPVVFLGILGSMLLGSTADSVCDACTDADSDGVCTDSDADGICDDHDNCPGESNPGQPLPVLLSGPMVQNGRVDAYLLGAYGPTFADTCTIVQTSGNSIVDSEVPLPGPPGFYYLVRALAPHVGSWGQDSTGAERTDICPGRGFRQ